MLPISLTESLVLDKRLLLYSLFQRIRDMQQIRMMDINLHHLQFILSYDTCTLFTYKHAVTGTFSEDLNIGSVEGIQLVSAICTYFCHSAIRMPFVWPLYALIDGFMRNFVEDLSKTLYSMLCIFHTGRQETCMHAWNIVD